MGIVIELRFRNFSHLVSGCASSAQQRLHWGARYSGRMRSSSLSLPAIKYVEETLQAKAIYTHLFHGAKLAESLGENILVDIVREISVDSDNSSTS